MIKYRLRSNLTILFIVFLILLPSSILANELTLDSNYLKGYATDSTSIPKSSWTKAPTIISIAAILYNSDQDIREWVQDNRNDTSNAVAIMFKDFGDGRYTLPALGALYTYGYLYQDTKAKKTALLSVESFVLSGIVVQTMKLVTHRHRPVSNDGYNTWDGFSLSGSNKSFSSGHAQAAFSVATVIATEYNDSNIIPTTAYTIATLTALSRINDDGHWASDVFVGSVVGYYTAKAVTKLHSNKDDNLTIIPVTNGKDSSLSIIYIF